MRALPSLHGRAVMDSVARSADHVALSQFGTKHFFPTHPRSGVAGGRELRQVEGLLGRITMMQIHRARRELSITVRTRPILVRLNDRVQLAAVFLAVRTLLIWVLCTVCALILASGI